MNSTKATCPSCGALRTDASACPVCGYLFEGSTGAPEQAENAVQYCPNCGKRISGSPRFCDQCGANLTHRGSGGVAASGSKEKFQFNKPLATILIAAAVVAAAIIVATGQFKSKAPEQPKQTAQQQGAQQQNPPAPSQAQLDAIKQFNQTLAANPNDTNAILHLADLYYDIEDYNSALPYYRQYIQHNPSNPPVLVDYAYCLFRNNDFHGSIAQMKKAIEIDPKFQQAYYNLSIVCLTSGEKDLMAEGLSWMKKCIAVDSTTQVAHEAKNMLENHSQLFQQQ